MGFAFERKAMTERNKECKGYETRRKNEDTRKQRNIKKKGRN
jgi:hypothetical protein